MPLKLELVTTCCGLGQLRCGLLLMAYFKFFANIFVVRVFYVLALEVFSRYPDKRLLFSLLLLSVIIWVIDLIFTVVLIYGTHSKFGRLLEYYYKYGLVFGALIIAQGSTWIVYFIMRSDISPYYPYAFSIFLLFLTPTLICSLFHVGLMILTNSLIAEIKSSSQTDLKTTFQDLL